MIQSFKIKTEEDLLFGAQMAMSVILSGGVVVFPADTCYGLAVDPTNASAVRRLYALKKRDKNKAISLIFKSIKHIGEWSVFDTRERHILEQYLPGQFTFLLKPNKKYPLQASKLGARIPINEFTRALSALLEIPYTATSANITSEPAIYNPNKLQNIFSDTARNGLVPNLTPDLIIDGGRLNKTAISTVVDLTTAKPAIIRQGSGVFG